MRSAPNVSQVVPTPARLLQQQKFGMMAKYLKPLKGIINVGFAHDAGLRKITTRNVAMSMNMANAMNWNGSAWEIVYDDVQLSRGLFLGVEDLYVGTQSRDMRVSWIYTSPRLAGLTDSGKEIWTSALDKVCVVMYNIVQGEALFFYVQRDTGAVVQSAPVNWQIADNIEAYVVTIPNVVAKYEIDPLNMNEEDIQLVNEIYADGFGVSNSVSGNTVL